MVGIFLLLNDFPNLLLEDDFWNFSNIFFYFSEEARRIRKTCSGVREKRSRVTK